MNGDDQSPQPTSQPDTQPATTSEPSAPKEAEAARSTAPGTGIQAPAQPAGGFFHADDTPAAAAPGSLPQDTPALQWNTAGLQLGTKTAGRSLLVAAGVLAVAVAVFLITKSYFSAIAILIIGLAFSFIGFKKPQAVTYAISDRGITIGQKQYGFNQFRSFAVIDEGGYTSIVLMPLDRFHPLLAVFYKPDIQDQVIEALAARLPMTEHRRDLIDKLTSLLKI